MAESKPTLYWTPVSQNARIPYIVSLICGVELDFEVLQPGKDTAAMKELSPKGQIPYLKDGDLELGESFAISRYLIQKSGNETLIPKDSQWAVEEACAHIATSLNLREGFVTFSAVGEQFFGADPDAMKALAAIAVPQLEKTLAQMERIYFKSSEHFLVGSTYTLADAMVLPRLDMLTLLAKYPVADKFAKLGAYLDHHNTVDGPSKTAHAAFAAALAAMAAAAAAE